DSPEQLIGELCRVSSEYVLLDYPSIFSFNCLSYFLFFLKRLIEKDTRKFTVFTHSEICKMAARNGFTEVRRINQFFWPLVIHRIHRSVALGKILERPFHFLGITKLFGSPTLILFKKTETVA